MQGLLKYTRKLNHNIRRVHKSTKFDNLLRYICLSDCNISNSTQEMSSNLNLNISQQSEEKNQAPLKCVKHVVYVTKA
jgi:hypothetical protein